LLKGDGVFNYWELSGDKLEYVAVASIDEIGNGESLSFEIDNNLIVVFNVGGQLFAVADICSHDDGPLTEGEVDGLEIVCPRHGARFELTTGKALSLPAVVDIPVYPVRLEGDEILIGLPVESE
jgi:3-phenylpropionate/trans-cinnamate dioxygenase ferredoxin subunit